MKDLNSVLLYFMQELVRACKERRKEEIASLIRHGANVNTADQVGKGEHIG